MATKDNFVKALKELTGFDEEGGELPIEADAVNERKESFQQALQEAKTAATEAVALHTEKPQVEVKPEPEYTPVSAPKMYFDTEKPAAKGGTTKITENMVVVGDINSNDKLDIMGRVRGDIQTSDDLVVEGIVEGGLSGKNMLLQGSALKGNVLATGDVAIEAGSVIVGNVQAENVKLDGKVKGNLFVAQMTQLTENALLLGDVETTGVAASVGSRIRGNIITKQLNNISEEDEFNLEV